MAYTLRYYKTLPQPGDRDIVLEIYEKDGAGVSMEIGPVIQALHLDIQGSQEDIDTPVVKTSLVMTFVDAPDHEEASSKKCGNWEEFYTPDSTYWKVLLFVKDSDVQETQQIWGGYVTPDSFTEQLRYRGSVTIVARDNIGHMQDFPFDSKGNEDGMITVYDLVNAAWAKIESPMSLNWRGEEDEAMWLQCDGHDVTGAYLNVSAFKGMNWYEAMEKVLYSIGAVMRYVGDNTVQVSSLRYMPYQGRASMSSLAEIEPKFIAHANRELVPAVRRIEESVKYDLVEDMQPLVSSEDFSGAVSDAAWGAYTAPVWPLINTASGNGWGNAVPSSAMYFNPQAYAIDEPPFLPAFEQMQEDIYNSMYLLCDAGQAMAEYSRGVTPANMSYHMRLGHTIQLYGSDTSGYVIVPSMAKIYRIRYAVKVTEANVEYFLQSDGSWSQDYAELEAYNDGNDCRELNGMLNLSQFSGGMVLHLYITGIESDAAGLAITYASVQMLSFAASEGEAYLQTNRINTANDESNNVILSHDPAFGPAYNLVALPGIIKNGMFIKSGDVYLPAKAWAWSGGTPQQMAVYNHLQILCYHAKPNNVITGDIVNADLGNLRALYMWHGSEHLLQGGSLNFLNGRIEGAILREFARYDDMWGDVTGDSMPATEQESSTNVEDGGSSSGSSSTYENTTNVTIGGEGGGSVTVDTFLSDTSTNPVQNRAIKAYVDSVDNQLEEKIGNLAEHIDDLELSKAVIFDATCSTDPWNLNVLQTSTTIEEIVKAINNGSPIYMRFGSGLVAVANAELYKNGDVSLYVHLVDSESELIRTIHAYSTTDGGWTWESFDNPMGGSANPDEEDITTNAEGKLQFKDRVAVDGMGYIILRKGKSLAEQMTQTDTMYEIRYDFDLQGSTLILPENSVLKFVGGRIANGTLRGTNTQIDAEPVKIFDSITFTGSWIADAVYAEWWGAEGYYARATYSGEGQNPLALNIPTAIDTLADSSPAINSALAFSAYTGGEVRLLGLVYRINSTLEMDRYSSMSTQVETMIVPYMTGAGTRIMTQDEEDATMTFEDLTSPALSLARNQLIDTSSMAIAIRINPVRTRLTGGGTISLLKSRYTIGVCVTSEDWHLMDMTYMSPVVDVVTVGDKRQTYAPDPYDLMGDGAPTSDVGADNTEKIYYWDKVGKDYYSRAVGGDWLLLSDRADPLWNTSLRFDIGNTGFARLINPQVTIKDIFGARGIEVYVRTPADYVEIPWFNQSIVKGAVSEKYSHYFGIFVERQCNFDIHNWYDVVVQHSPVNMRESCVVYAVNSGNVKFGMIWDLAWIGTRAKTSFYLGTKTKGMSLMTLSGGTIVDLGQDNTYPGKEGGTENAGRAFPRVEMTATSAVLQPNTFHVWPMVDSLELTLGAEQSGVMNKYLFQFCNPKAGLTMLTLPDDIIWSEDTELDENGLPVMEAAAFYRIEIIEGLASLKKWKLVYINFADAEVERVLMANGVGDGIGITKRDAKSVTSIGAMFVNNEVVESFEEFEFFTGITAITGSPWENGGFRGCTNLKRLRLPNSLQTIFDGATPGQYLSTGAFKDCTSLESITIPPKVVRIPRSAFYNCTNLKNIVFEGDVKEIIEYAFAECVNLDIVIPASVEHIGTRSFFNAPMKDAVIDLPNLKYLSGIDVFTRSKIRRVANLGSITDLTFQTDPPAYYGNYPTFYYCEELEEVNLPPTLTHIGRNMFQGCSSLKSIAIPQGVAELFAGTFAECYNLEWMKVEAVTPPALHSLDCIDTGSNYPIYVPNASVEAYKTAMNWNSYAHRIRGMQDFILGIVTPQNIRCSSSILTAENAVGEKVWSIVGGSEFATITEDGILTILPNASDAEVTIRCTDDNGNVAEKTINVTYNAPLMYLPFDEDFVDAMGNATLVSATECSIDASKGKVGASMNRPYTAGGLSYQPSFNASFADKSFSVDVWVYLPSNAPNAYLGIAGKRTNAGRGASWSFGINGQRVNIGLSANGGGFTNDFYTDAVIPFNRWTRVTMVRDYERGEYRVYVDASLAATFSAAYALYDGTDGLAVGNYHTDSSNDYFVGNLDEFRIYEGCIFD